MGSYSVQRRDYKKIAACVRLVQLFLPSLLITASKKRVTCPSWCMPSFSGLLSADSGRYSADVAVLLAELTKLVFAAAMLPPEA